MTESVSRQEYSYSSPLLTASVGGEDLFIVISLLSERQQVKVVCPRHLTVAPLSSAAHELEHNVHNHDHAAADEHD